MSNSSTHPDNTTHSVEARLSDDEIALLRKVAVGMWLLKDNKTSPRVESLISRGYLKTSKVRLGPLGIYTGELSVGPTEAGRAILE